jgi:DNA polymerase-3 subunit delta'
VELIRPLGHAALIQDLWRAAAAGRLGHALLFEGPQGIGKFVAARWFAQGLLCQRGPLSGLGAQEPCGVCPGCKKLASGGYMGNHPDCLVIDRAAELADGADGGPGLSVAHVAARSGDEGGSTPPLEEFLNLKPSEGPLRLVLLREAERLNEAAQNALLKTLEEPALGTFLVLETAQPQELLTTLRSRTLRVRFGPLSAEEFAGWARTRPEFQNGLPASAFGLAGGAPGLLLSYLSRGGPAQVELWLAALSGSNPGTQAFLGAEGETEASTELGRRRERAALSLEVLASLLRDVWLLGIGAEGAGALVHRERREQLEALAGRWPAARAAGLLLGTGELLGDLGSNLDPEATLERALARLQVA